MKRKLQQVEENGKKVWRLTDGEAAKVICHPCAKMQKAQRIAERVTAEIEAEKIINVERHKEQDNEEIRNVEKGFFNN